MFEHEEVEPVPVHVVNHPDNPVREYGPELASWASWNLLGTEGPFQILPRDMNRSEATILVTSTVASAYGRVGHRKQCAAPQSGFILGATAGSITYKAQEAVFIVPDGVNPITVSVIDQRFQR